MTKDNYCLPMKCSGFYPWGAKFCHICGKPFKPKDIKKANKVTGKESMLL